MANDQTYEKAAGEDDVGTVIPPAEEAAVKLWVQRVRDARRHWKPDFKRMRDNMDFAAGIQWASQTVVDDDDKFDMYVANLTIRMVNEKVAALYARNPKAEFQRRKRLDYQVWDMRMESLQQAFQSVAQSMMVQPGMPPQAPDMHSMAIIADFQQGRAHKDQVERIGHTLEINYQWQVDEQPGGFKKQAKQLVRRTITNGVGYVKIGFEREYTSSFENAAAQSQIGDRMKRIKYLAGCVAKDGYDEEGAESQELKTLLLSIQQSLSDGDANDISERLVFDFPESTAIIVDPKCRSLKNFDGARWIAEEFIMPLEEVNEFFETDIKAGGELQTYGENGDQKDLLAMEETDKQSSPMACVWQIYDLRTKSMFFICDGWKGYVQKPGPPDVKLKRFWPIFALTFNDVEVVPGIKATIFPPSDVTLIKSAQREWNRTRESLRGQRKANAPVYVTGAGWLSDDDKLKLVNAKPNSVVELNGVASGTDLNKLLVPFQHATIDPSMYQTEPLREDIAMAAGSQQANLGATTSSTATESSIAEQSRMSTNSSNIDDLDDLLDDLAVAGGEVMLREFSPQTITQVAGPGAVWPQTQEDRQNYIDELFLTVKAASSGRPNKALDLSNFERIAPFLLQAGVNPAFFVREGLRRLDDQLEPDDAFPLIPQGEGAAGPGAANMLPQANAPASMAGGAQPQAPWSPVQLQPALANS